uniref:(northern house mosquito) hypothetical protein n=1 Tax=Culex pipiens TaxID=7175 RepID=A0A8D8BFZ7_CULPI
MQPGVQATLVAGVAHEDPPRGAEPCLRRVRQLLQAGGTSARAHQRSPSEAQAVQLRGLPQDVRAVGRSERAHATSQRRRSTAQVRLLRQELRAGQGAAIARPLAHRRATVCVFAVRGGLHFVQCAGGTHVEASGGGADSERTTSVKWRYVYFE